ncbi:MAG: oligosaccharide flippase family protein [Legionella sp.]|nr:oligosaccharide flippase family protein [Legionella sp.]
MNKDIKSSVELFSQSLIGFFIQLGLGIFLARHLTESLYGDYNVAIKLLSILVTFSLYGTNVGANRFLAKYIQKHRLDSSIKYLAWNIKLLSITFLISLIIAFIAFIMMWGLHHLNVKHINHYHLAVYSLWLVPFFALAVIINSLLISSEHAQISTFYSRILKYLIILALFVLIALYIDPMLHNVSIILILFISSVVLSSISSLSINRDLLSMIYQGIKQIKATQLTEKKWMTTSSHLIANNILYAVICALDLLVVEVVAGSEVDTGYYAAALTITYVLWLVPASIYQELKPQLASLLKNKSKKQELQQRVKKINLISFVLLLLVSFFLIAFENQLLRLFGPSYLNAKTIVPILAVGYSVACYTRMSIVLLIMGGYEKIVLQSAVIEFLTMLILLIPSTYYYGIIGTAVATSIVITLKGIFCAVIAQRKLGMQTSSF